MHRYHILGLIFLGIISRLIPHPPNFTAIDAMAIMGASSLGNIWLSSLAVFASLFLSDILLGFHTEIHFIYISYAVITLLSYWYSKSSVRRNLILFVTSALIFFIITNFGSWLNTTLYPKTMYGLGCSYIAALPFLVNQITGNIFYSFLIIGLSAVFSANKARN